MHRGRSCTAPSPAPHRESRCWSIRKFLIQYYAGTTLVTPNHHEAEVATNTRIRSEEEARAAARQFRTRAQCENVLMTEGIRACGC